MPIPSILAVALGALSLNPSSVPAQGSQQSLLTVDKTSMVHLWAVNPAGTSCEVVDHLRGPFASSGQSGHASCDTDLLLDSGVYKIRLTSPTKGKGTVTLKVEPFKEVNAPLLRLDKGRTVDETLKPHEQASFWIHVDGRQYVPIRVSGRTAGEVKLWKSGEWVEEVAQRPQTAMPVSGHPIHEWWLGRYLEAGDYLLTVYGTAAQKWTKGPEEDSLSVSYLYNAMPPERFVDVTLPAHGVLVWSLPKSTPMVHVALPAAASAPVGVSLVQLDKDGAGRLELTGGCSIEPKALVPECALTGWEDSAFAIVLRGPPGARAHVEWARFARSGPFDDGDFTSAGNELSFRAPASGKFLVGYEEAPANPDEAPLSCVLEQWHPNPMANSPNTGSWEPFAQDLFTVAPKTIIDRKFNYDGNSETIQFEITGGSSYAISTGGERKNRCELFRIVPESWTKSGGKSRVTGSSKDPGCKLDESLSPGAYELKLYGGNSGIETLRIADSNKSWFGSNKLEKASGQKTGCLFESAALEKGALYRIVPSRSALSHPRGLTLRPLPLALDRLAYLEIAPGKTLELPVVAGRAMVVAANGAVSCALGDAPAVLATDGVCKLPEITSAKTLVLTSRSHDPLTVRLSRPVPPPTPPPLQVWNPTFAPIPPLALDAPAYFDFARAEAHSLSLEVKEAGLYHLTTVGLLSTSCRIRTPATLSLATDGGSGRGRNCLVAGYLRPGRYLATATAVGQSKGRGGVLLTRRPSKPGPEVAVDAQAFFKVDADTLLAQTLVVPKPARVKLATIARGGKLSCRLEDKDGWPLVPVPGACEMVRDFDAGAYLWLQLPLTVESMRRTELEKIRPPVVLLGGKPHEIGYNTWYDAKLGKPGKDEFLFDVPADLDVQLVISNAMQGRLYRLEEKGVLKPVEFIAPQVEGYVPPQADQPAGEEGMYRGDPPADNPEGGPPLEGEGPPPDSDGEYQPPPSPPPRYSPPPAPALVSVPNGQPLHLAQGRYKLVAEHSREDVNVSYRLYLRSDVLAPGIGRDVGAPTKLTVRVPREGILRLRTRGETDVRCRLFDSQGRLAAESSGFGDDWNCALAEPVAAGEYSLVIESETLAPGLTHVGVGEPKIETVAALAEGATLKLATSVVLAPLPDTQGDVVQEVTLKSGGPTFSCDVSGKGGVVARQSNVRDCSFLLRPRGEKLSLRAWTLEKLAPVTVHVAAKPVLPGSGRIAGGAAVLAAVEREGRWRTSAGVFCLPEAKTGALEPCGPAVSLEKGRYVFAALGPGEAGLPLDEVIFAAPEAPADGKERLAQKPWIQTQRSSGSALHLLRVTGLLGERSAPSCALSPGSRVVKDTDCFAASGLVEEAVARAWTAGEEGEAAVARLAVKLPKEAVALAAGQQTLSWPGTTARLSLPVAPARTELVLPAETWAVQLDATGRALDLCPPEKDLSRCVFASRGGEIALWSGEGDRRAEVTVILGETPSRARLVAGLWESVPKGGGFIVVEVPASGVRRRLEVEGARYCSVRFADGNRAAGCVADLPANLAAELLVGHDGKPLRALAHVPEDFLEGLFPRPMGAAPPAAASLTAMTMAQAMPLVGGFFERSLTLDKPAVVHLRGDSGVCGLTGGRGIAAADGLGAGCEVHRLLEAGAHRVLARPFDGQPFTGTISWTQTAVETLADGVGAERLLAPGQAQLFRFTLASAGRVGIGLQQPAETLACAVKDASQAKLGDGCQQFLKLEAGSYLLEVRAPAGVRATRFKPVVVGLSGAKMEVPVEYLRSFFQRIGGLP